MKSWVLSPVAAPARPAGEAGRHGPGRALLIAGLTAAVAGGLWLGGTAGTMESSPAFTGEPVLALLFHFGLGALLMLAWREGRRG